MIDKHKGYKIGDIVWIRDGNGWGRSRMGNAPIQVKITGFIDDCEHPHFEAFCPKHPEEDWVYKYDEIINAPKGKKRRGRLIGGIPIQ